MDWQQIEEAASIVLRDGKLPTRSKESIKRALGSRSDPHSVLEALCVLDSLALNCGRAFRSALAAPKWMKRLTQCFMAVPQTAPAVAQLFANWELTFRGEELGASAHATRKQLQASSDVLPQPNHFAHDMREYFEQHIPFIGFQHGFDFLSAYSDADSAPSRAGDQAPDHPISQFQAGYLQDMSADLHSLEKCTAVLQQESYGQRPSHYDSAVRTGNALASKCCNWRACIQEWAADELLSYSLADMLVMNDRMHAELQRWEHVTQSLVLTQRMPMAVSMGSPSDGALQDHSQWFSPLGSSASRFTQDSPTSTVSALPTILSGVPILGSNALGRATPRTGQEEQAIPSSAQQGSHHVGGASVPLSPLYHQWISSHIQVDAGAASASRSDLAGQERLGGAPLGSWVAFDDSAQSAVPMVLNQLQTAWNEFPELSATSAQTAHTTAAAQPAASTAGITAASLGNTSDQSNQTSIPGFATAQSAGSLAQPVTISASAQRQRGLLATPLAQNQGVGGDSPTTVRPTHDAGVNLLQWGGPRTAPGQSASTASAGAVPAQGVPGSMSGCAGMSAMPSSLQLPAYASCGAVPVRVVGSSCRVTGSAGASSSIAQRPQSLASDAEQASMRPLTKSSTTDHELQSLKQELAAEHAARVKAEQQFKNSCLRESGLQKRLAELEDKLRDRELQLWNARLAARQGSDGDKGMAKRGTTHAIMAWCHQPALRVRFSAGQLEALAGRRELL